MVTNHKGWSPFWKTSFKKWWYYFDPMSMFVNCCSFYTSWVINQWKSCILKISKKHPTLGVWCAPPKYFSEFFKSFLGFYKSQFPGTTFVLVEKRLLLVYGLFKNSKKLTFVRVRHHKTLNSAIYIRLNQLKRNRIR